MNGWNNISNPAIIGAWPLAEDVAGQIVYRWDADAAGYSPASEFYICVYQRKL